MIFHISFAIAFFAFIAIRVTYHRKAKRSRQDVKFNEGKLNMAVRAFLGLGYIGALLVYIFYPALFEWAEISLPIWVRWFGLVFSVLSVGLIWWVQWALDVQFDTTLHHQTDHRLITHGPYRWVRHPMYTTLFLMGLGWLLLTVNWFIGAPLMVGIIIIVNFRVKNEEAMLLDLFGDEYQDYMKHTGRYLPSFSSGGRNE